MIRSLTKSILPLLLILSSISFTHRLRGEEKQLGKLDGAFISSLENKLKSYQNGFNFGTTILPSNPYYRGVGLYAGYNYYFTKDLSWEVIRGTYLFSIQTDLTSELADTYQVAPEKIEKVFIMVKSNVKYFLIYGKSLLSDEHINRFRLALLGGPALAFTDAGLTTNVKFMVNVGIALEVYINHTFLWTFEFQDAVSIEENWKTFPAFSLGLKKVF